MIVGVAWRGHRLQKGEFLPQRLTATKGGTASEQNARVAWIWFGGLVYKAEQSLTLQGVLR